MFDETLPTHSQKLRASSSSSFWPLAALIAVALAMLVLTF